MKTSDETIFFVTQYLYWTILMTACLMVCQCAEYDKFSEDLWLLILANFIPTEHLGEKFLPILCLLKILVTNSCWFYAYCRSWQPILADFMLYVYQYAIGCITLGHSYLYGSLPRQCLPFLTSLGGAYYLESFVCQATYKWLCCFIVYKQRS